MDCCLLGPVRLMQQVCSPVTAVIYRQLLQDVEKVDDHHRNNNNAKSCSNIMTNSLGMDINNQTAHPPTPGNVEQEQKDQETTTKTDRPRRHHHPHTVTFCPTVQVVQNGSEPITKQERLDAFYQKYDYKQFQKDIKGIVQIIQEQKVQQQQQQQENQEQLNDEEMKTLSYCKATSDDNDDDGNTSYVNNMNNDEEDENDTNNDEENIVCTWGLEKAINMGIRQKNRQLALHAVLLEQEMLFQEQEQKRLHQQRMNNNKNDDDENDDDDVKNENNMIQECIAQAYQECTSDSVVSAYLLGLKYAQEQPYNNSSATTMSFGSILAQENKLLRRQSSSTTSTTSTMMMSRHYHRRYATQIPTRRL